MIVVALLALAGVARADLPPPPDIVEACTVAVCPAGTTSQTCAASFEGRGDCEALEAKGYVRACKSAGASAWTEVMCASTAGNEPPVTPATPKGVPAPTAGGCATAPAGSSGAALLLALGVLAARRRP